MTTTTTNTNISRRMIGRITRRAAEQREALARLIEGVLTEGDGSSPNIMVNLGGYALNVQFYPGDLPLERASILEQCNRHCFAGVETDEWATLRHAPNGLLEIVTYGAQAGDPYATVVDATIPGRWKVGSGEATHGLWVYPVPEHEAKEGLTYPTFKEASDASKWVVIEETVHSVSYGGGASLCHGGRMFVMSSAQLCAGEMKAFTSVRQTDGERDDDSLGYEETTRVIVGVYRTYTDAVCRLFAQKAAQWADPRRLYNTGELSLPG
jgi:hypothetical protein